MMRPAKQSLLVAILVAFSVSITLQAQTGGPINPDQMAGFARLLIKTKSETERNALLEANKELLTPGLRRELVRQGNLLLLEEKYSPASDIYRLAQNIAGQINDKEGIAATSLNIGTVYYFQGSYDQAVEQYLKARDLFTEVGNRAEAAQALVGLALTYKDQRKSSDALRAFQQAFKEFEAMGNKEEMARTLSNIGATYYAKGDYAAATQALLKGAELGDPLENQLQIADALYMQGEYSEALKYYQSSLKRFEADRNPAGIVSALVSTANSHYYLGHYDQALEYYQKGLALEERLDDQSGMAAALQGIGNVYRVRGDFGSALESYLRGLRVAEQSPIKVNTATTLGSIGVIRALQGDNEQALSYYQKSLALFEATGDKVGMARMLSHMGNAEYAQGNYPLALETYQKALALREAMGDKSNSANILSGIGTVHLGEQDYKQALESYENAIVIYTALGNKAELADTMTKVANSYLTQQDYPRALDVAVRAAALAREGDSPDTQWFALLESGKAQRALNQPAEALGAFTDAIAIIELLHSQPPTGDSTTERSGVSAYVAVVELLTEQGRGGDALEYAERGKVQMLSEILRRGHAKIAGKMSLKEQDAETRLINDAVSLRAQLDREGQAGHPDAARLDRLRARLRQARTDYSAFRRTVYATYPQLKINRGELPEFKFAEASNLIADNHTALIEFALSEDNGYLFVLSREQDAKSGKRGVQTTRRRGGTADSAVVLKVYPLNTRRKELTERIKEFQRLLLSRDDLLTNRSRELYDLLLRPAQEQLEGKTRLVIVPDGPLWNLPFEALQLAPDKFLIEQMSTSYAPSLAALREMRKQRDLHKNPRAVAATLLAFGNPALSENEAERIQVTYGGKRLASVPEKEIEVQKLKSVYGEAHTRLYTGAGAGEDRLQSEKGYGVLHFAAHAFLDDASPMYSFIALSPGEAKQSDGLLHVGEIITMHSDADLVVMSAASMAQGKTAVGNAEIATAWAWYVAGSCSTVLSRWDEDSPSATEMMAEFHARLRSRRTPVPKAEALRQSALKLAHSPDTRNPYYWSGFMVIGDGR